MPYILQKHRFKMMDGRTPPGELSYKLAALVDKYLAEKGGPSYGNYNDVIGVLECLKLEIYRRFAGPYEDEKLAQNGEVFFHDHARVKLRHV